MRFSAVMSYIKNVFTLYNDPDAEVIADGVVMKVSRLEKLSQHPDVIVQRNHRIMLRGHILTFFIALGDYYEVMHLDYDYGSFQIRYQDHIVLADFARHLYNKINVDDIQDLSNEQIILIADVFHYFMHQYHEITRNMVKRFDAESH